MLRAACDHADLTFHALAFVPPRPDAPSLVRAASLHRPAWMQFAAEHLPPAAVVPIARDAPLVGALATSAEAALALARLATLHTSIASFLATVRLPLAEVDPSAVCRPADLAEIVQAPPEPVEIFRAAIALAARPFAAVHAASLHPFAERVIAHLAPRWKALVTELPGLAPIEVHVSATLGAHGRLVDDTVLVGTSTLPHAPAPVDTDTPLAIAAHEASVRAAARALREHGARASWSLIERVALDAAEVAYRGTTAGDAYTLWRTTLDTRGLVHPDATTAALAAEAARFLTEATPAAS